MKKFILIMAVVVFLGLCSFLSAQTTIYSTTFPADPTGSGWTINTVTGPVTWEWTTEGGAYGGQLASTTAADGYMMADSDGNGTGAPEETDLISPAINCSAVTDNIMLYVEHYARTYGAANVQILISTDDFATETQLYQWVDGAVDDANGTNPVVSVFNITSIAQGQANVKVKFKWIGAYDYWWLVDDFKVYSVANIPVAAPLLLHPADGATGLTPGEFELHWAPNQAGGEPLIYTVYMWNDPENPYEYSQETTETHINPLTGFTTPPPLAISEDPWYWTVEADNEYGDPAVATEFLLRMPENIAALEGFDYVEEAETPVWPTWAYTYSQSIYLQEELARGPKEIQQLKWYWNGVSAITEPNIDIYMGHTDQDAFAGGFLPVSGMQLVYSGPYATTATPGWITFTLDTPFIYNNTDNLVVAANETGGDPGVYYPDGEGFYNTDVGTTRSWAKYNDAAPYDPVTTTGGAGTTYVPNAQFVLGTITETDPIYQIGPLAWDYGSIDVLDDVQQEFIITNFGMGTATITGIQVNNLTPVGETNFSMGTLSFPITLGSTESYSFPVTFTPQTTGDKTGSLVITDGRTTTTIPLSGSAHAEFPYQAIALTGSVNGGNNVLLNWTPTYSDGNGSWIHYDSGTNYQAIGTGGPAVFDVAIKFTDFQLAGYVGQDLTAIRFFPREDANYTMKIWTGTTYPETLVFSEFFPGETEDIWNEFGLREPYEITAGTNLFIGYEVDTPGTHPAGCDAGPANAGSGDLISLGTSWVSMATQYGLDYNWNIQAYITPGGGGKHAPLLSIPVASGEPELVKLPRDLFTASPEVNPDGLVRSLNGYNVYRDATLLTTGGPIMAFSYSDPNLPAGSFDYTVQAVYNTTTITSNVWTGVSTGPAPFPLPFREYWDSPTNFATQTWDPSAANWVINTSYGRPAPSAAFSYAPVITDYEEYLTSYNLDGTGHTQVTLSFFLAFVPYSYNTVNSLALEVWDGTGWNTIDTYVSSNYALMSLAWQYKTYDISAYAAGHEFKFRFKAYGANSDDLFFILVDNINCLEEPATIATPAIDEIVQSAGNIYVYWEEVPGAVWYGIYYTDDPYGDWTYLGYVPYPFTGVNMGLSVDKEFFKVTAGVGSLPRGQRLEGVMRP